MKLGTLRNGRPDGHLVVVSSDLSRCVSAGRIAPHLQAALDDWDTAQPTLQELSQALDAGRIGSEPFDPLAALAPLPRAYQRIGAAAFSSYGERLRRGSGTADDGQARRPELHQSASDRLAGPAEPLHIPDGDASADFSAEVVAILGAVPMRPSRVAAAGAIRLLTIANEVTFRRLVADDLQHGSGIFHARHAAAFAPVAVTPDEIGPAWRNEKLALPVRVIVNNMLFGQPDAGAMQPDFAELIIAAARMRALGAGTLLGSGTISNRHDETPPIRREGVGFASIAEARAAEKAKYGRGRTPFLKVGDRVRIAAIDGSERAVFGTIDQTVVALPRD